ncbi:hypothetical protein [Cesiribacter sp. SM1]|uniref:hypothetical protein n=1 Tax=Cesiribacter sp. SM1 TaxID=2861196 RepID=UPI001CD659C1|nr:hypothetical protein [Cesiribacter sp. SM1]
MILPKINHSLRISTFIFFVGLFIFSNSSAQQSITAPDTGVVSYPKMLLLINDTIEGKKANHLLQVQWMDTVFQLDRKYADFITDVPVPKQDNPYYTIYREEPWDGEGFVLPHANCHTFGLAQSFSYEGIDPLPWFNPTTFLDPAMLEVVLTTAYEKEYSLDATFMGDLKQPISTGSLLIFRDSAGYALHTAFQGEEGLLSKNGRFEPRIYNRLEYLKKVYYNATTIDIYRMDADKVKGFLEERQLQALMEK